MRIQLEIDTYVVEDFQDARTIIDACEQIEKHRMEARTPQRELPLDDET